MPDFDKYFNINNDLFESDLANNGMDSIEEQANQEFSSLENTIEESCFGIHDAGMIEENVADFDGSLEESAFSKAKDWVSKNKNKLAIGAGGLAAAGAGYGAHRYMQGKYEDKVRSAAESAKAKELDDERNEIQTKMMDPATRGHSAYMHLSNGGKVSGLKHGVDSGPNKDGYDAFKRTQELEIGKAAEISKAGDDAVKGAGSWFSNIGKD